MVEHLTYAVDLIIGQFYRASIADALTLYLEGLLLRRISPISAVGSTKGACLRRHDQDKAK